MYKLYKYLEMILEDLRFIRLPDFRLKSLNFKSLI